MQSKHNTIGIEDIVKWYATLTINVYASLVCMYCLLYTSDAADE